MPAKGNYSIKQIKTVLAEAHQAGEVLLCVFQCPRTKREFRSSVSITRTQHHRGMEKAAREVKGGLMRTVQTQMLRSVGHLLGNGTAGQIARSLGNTAFAAIKMKDRTSSNPMFDRDVEEAFARVQENFVWDDKEKSFFAIESEREAPDTP